MTASILPLPRPRDAARGASPAIGAPARPHPDASTGASRAPAAASTISSPARLASLVFVLAATAVAYVWNLAASGWANAFYAAAAQAGSQNWTAWFFGSLDAGNAITVDKPPASLWIMGLSMRLFGVNSWALLVPQAIMGVLTAWCLYATVRRALSYGPGGLSVSDAVAHWSGIAAAVIFATTPVAALMFRFDNPDALLVLLLTAAVYATVRATEAGSRRWLMLAGVAVGFAFLTKMMQAFLVLPALVLAYGLLAPRRWGRRIVDLLAAFVSMLVAAGWYVAVFTLTPASQRPYMGGSQTNSFLELVFGYNGFGRLTGNEVGSVGRTQRGPGVGTGGVTRLFTGVSGGMVSWLLPAALILLVVGIALVARRHVAPEHRQPLVGLLALGGTLLVTAVVFSSMEGIYHDYYTVALAPFLAGTVAVGAALAWRQRHLLSARIGLALASAVTGVWSAFLSAQAGGVYAVVGMAAAIVGVCAGFGLLFVQRLSRRVSAAVIVASLAAGVAGPTAYTLDTIATPHTGSIVTAGPVTSRGGMGGPGGQGAPGGMSGQGGRARGSWTGNGSGTGAGGQSGMNQAGTGQAGTGQAGTGQAGAPQGNMAPPAGMGGNPGAGMAPAGMGPGGTAGSTVNNGGQPGAAGGIQPGTASGSRRGNAGGMGGLLDGASVSSQLKAMLESNADQYTWVAATVGSQNAASYQLATNKPVMAVGGFNGSDPSPTLAQFQQLVAQGKIHYFVGGGGFGNQNGGSTASSEIAAWVTSTYRATTIDGVQVYDLTAK